MVRVEACKTKLACHLNWPCVGLASIKCSLWGIDGGLTCSLYVMLLQKHLKTFCCLSWVLNYFSFVNSDKLLGHCKIGVLVEVGGNIGPCYPKLLTVWSYIKQILSIYPS